MDMPQLPAIWKIPKEDWQKRIESLLWRAGMMVAALVIDFLIQNLGDFNIPVWAVGVLGLALGEWSKAIHNNLDVVKAFASTGMGMRAVGGFGSSATPTVAKIREKQE